ncbi:nucleotide-diphospho-sugar transferase [Thozetella sp. PMI_491]|nr:nucleotide-diphospho-sugar transferase [Thozetella sp. PMI_491]
MLRLATPSASPIGERIRSCTSRVPLPRPARFTLAKLAALTLLLYISYLVTSPLAPGRWASAVPRYGNPDEPQRPPIAPKVATFWGELLEALIAAEPDQTQITPNHTLERADFDPTHPDHHLGLDIILNVTEAQKMSLKTNHQTFLGSLPALAPKLPYEKGSRGIVITANPDLLGITVTSLLMLRRSGSALPVEVFLSNSTDHGRVLCDKALRPLGAQCFNMEDFLRGHPGAADLVAPELVKFQFKVFALLFSSFQSVLFLDADAFPLHNPDYLMRAEPFASHGLVTFPDFWLPTVSPIFWDIASPRGREAAPEVTVSSRATESGIMLFDKQVHSETLLLATYYNLYGPRVYYWLQSSGAWGTGDKETFRLAAEVLGKPVWHVRVGPDFMSPDSVHDGSGIRQYDPEEDWYRYKQEIAAAKVKRATQDEAAGEMEKREEEKKDGDAQAAEGEKITSRWIFVHTNRVKIDARRLLKTIKIAKDKDGNWMRMWGDDSGPLIEAAGYDLEKTLWQELIKADCSHSSYLEDCEAMHDFYNTVFRD